RGPGRLALQRPSDLADVLDIAGGDPPDDRAAVGQQIDDANPRQFDQRLADRGVADAESVGEGLRDEPFAGAKPALEDVREDGADDRLAAAAVVEPGLAGGAGGRRPGGGSQRRHGPRGAGGGGADRKGGSW